MVLISKNFLIENLSVRFAIPVISVIFKNSAAVTNTRPGHQSYVRRGGAEFQLRFV